MDKAFPFTALSSTQNATFKAVMKLRDRRNREKRRLTVLEGYRELTRASEYGMELVECFFAIAPAQEQQQRRQQRGQSSIPPPTRLDKRSRVFSSNNTFHRRHCR